MKKIFTALALIPCLCFANGGEFRGIRAGSVYRMVKPPERGYFICFWTNLYPKDLCCNPFIIRDVPWTQYGWFKIDKSGHDFAYTWIYDYQDDGKGIEYFMHDRLKDPKWFKEIR